METSRLGNLKRFFSISDTDKVWDVTEESKVPDSVCYDYIFWNPELVEADSRKNISLGALWDKLSKGGSLVVFFDNPGSIHQLSIGKLDRKRLHSMSYALLRSEVEAFCLDSGAYAVWYYPYPCTDFPSMFFTDRRLPLCGECDDNFYNFDEPVVEVLDEREAVDALTAAGMYPYFAHAYMVILSEKKLEDRPIFTRFSNERRRDKQIRTDLMENRVKKSAVTREAAGHIKQMVTYEKSLSRALAGLTICGKPCEINHVIAEDEETMSVSFAYVQGESLENMLDRMLAEGREKEVVGILLEVCRQLRNIDGLVPFVETPEFVEVFGKMSMTDGQPVSLPVTDIDMVSQNILLSDKAVIIDYEWTFAFPVPLDFLIFRFLYFYLEAKQRDCMKYKAFAEVYAKAGIRSEDKEIFLRMETCFQRYVQQGTHLLRNSYEKYGNTLITRGELSDLLAEKAARCSYVIYEDKTRRTVRDRQEKEGVLTFRFPVKPHERIEFYFSSEDRGEGEAPGVEIFRLGALIEKEDCQEGISFETKGLSLGGLLYAFAKQPVKIIFPGEPEAVHGKEEGQSWQILVSVEKLKMTGSAAEELIKTVSELQFLVDNREQQLAAVKNSASWKITRPLRRLKGNKEE